MGYAFISYSTKNQIAADSVNKILKDNGIETWMAPADIPPGEKYAGVISQAIRGCSCFVLLLSNDSQSSVWVAKECERAVSNRKTVIPVQLEEVVLNDEFELYISSNHAIPLHRIDHNSESMQRLLAAVKACVGVKASIPKNGVFTAKAENGAKRKITVDNGYYYGDFPEGREITGYGEFTWNDGSRYVGDIVNGVLHGTGEIFFANGDYYKGDWLHGERTGKGEMLWKEGGQYIGDFVNGTLQGQGEYSYSDGRKYIGSFAESSFNGKGEFFWLNGDYYIGDWINGERTGKGEYRWGIGSRYVGDFFNSKLNGNGIYYFPDGNKYVGSFKNDSFDKGVVYDVNGKIVERY